MVSSSVVGLPELDRASRRRNGLIRVGSRLGQFMRSKQLAGCGLLICVVVVCLAIFADLVAPYGYDDSVGNSLESPNGNHWMGTDRLGRDTFSRITYGARASVFVGLGSVALGTAIATLIGMMSVGGSRWLDLVLQRFVDAFMAFPSLVLLLTVISIVGASVTGMIVVLGILFGIGSSRVVRGAAVSVSAEDYLLAGRSIGCSWFRLKWRYMLPNILPTLIVLATVLIGAAVLAEASVSFLGFGIQPPTPTWGRMLSTDIAYMTTQPWLAVWPGLALTVTVFGCNVLGDGLRDVFDPKLRGR
jgi:peptide/nickel transport system permease protein